MNYMIKKFINPLAFTDPCLCTYKYIMNSKHKTVNDIQQFGDSGHSDCFIPKYTSFNFD